MIPVADPVFGEAEREAVAEVLADGIVADGPEVRRFESAFAEHCGADHAVATANGTTALHAALAALRIGAGDRVVTTPFSFVASANAIRLAGATPVFADVDPETFALDPDAVDAVVREVDADAVLAVHLYGHPAPMERLREVADDHGLLLVEDAAQAHGARIRGEHVGTVGDAAAFSFYPTKNMSTGEGGMILADCERVAGRAASYVDHGRTEDGGYAHPRLGHNYRMTSIAAAIGRVQLRRLPDRVATRREHAERLTDALADVPGIEPPTEREDCRHAYHQYTVRCEHRDRLRDQLASAGVGTAVYYPTPIHELGAYDGFDADAPVAERAAAEVLSLPVRPTLDETELDRVISAVRTAEVPA